MGGTPRCSDCGADMQRCGEIVFDGPSFDCPQCQQIATLRAENAELKLKHAALAAECRAWRTRPGHDTPHTCYFGDGWDEIRRACAQTDAMNALDGQEGPRQ